MLEKDLLNIKHRSAEFVVDLIEPGMTIGLGTGSTAELVMEEIAAGLKAEKLNDLTFVPSSVRTEKFASGLGISLSDINDVEGIDINIDGADEVDADSNLIKGGGGALLREKIMAQSSRRNVVVVDQSKLSGKLGEKWHLPVEVLPFGHSMEISYLASIGAKAALRKNADGEAFRTDQGNYVLDCDFGIISDPLELSIRLDKRAGIIGHGLFVGTTSDLIIGRAGLVEHRRIK